MVDRQDDFKALMERLSAGDRTAAAQVVDRYGEHITRAIRRRFRTRKMRVLYATEDCMQSVWGSIFSDLDRLAKIESPEHLMKHLVTVAGNKLIDRDRKLRARRNDVYRECDLPDADSPDRSALATGDLTPSQVVAIDDEWEVRTRGLSPEQRSVLDLHRQGHTSEEIAAKTDFSGRGVRRIIQQFREMFTRISDFSDDVPGDQRSNGDLADDDDNRDQRVGEEHR